MSNSAKPHVFRTPSEMKEVSRYCRQAGKKLGFVPTMGSLHEGHISLVRESIKRADQTVVSIFVNPMQFGPNEDFDRYQRNYLRDVENLKRNDVDYLFYPETKDIYPDGYQTTVLVGNLADHLCGPQRPGHFNGVATVVLKLLNIVCPDFAVFGRKDFQQLRIIQRMVKDFNLDVEIVEMAIIREPDGLAMSSRNAYLDSGERIKATALKKSLDEVSRKFRDGCDNCEILIAQAQRVLKTAQINDIDYIEIRDPQTLELRRVAKQGDLLAMAIRIGDTRLIDNILL